MWVKRSFLFLLYFFHTHTHIFLPLLLLFYMYRESCTHKLFFVFIQVIHTCSHIFIHSFTHFLSLPHPDTHYNHEYFNFDRRNWWPRRRWLSLKPHKWGFWVGLCVILEFMASCWPYTLSYIIHSLSLSVGYYVLASQIACNFSIFFK